MLRRSRTTAPPKSGLTLTLDVLTKTHNEAAVELLVAALESPLPAIQEGALAALLKRRTIIGHSQVLARLSTMNSHGRKIVAENHRSLGRALREAIQSVDPSQFAMGCSAALEFRDYDMLPVFVHAAEDDANPNRVASAQHALKLAELLYEDLAAGRNSSGRDPQLMRKHVLHSLEQSLARYTQHHRPEIVEAFLILAPREHPVLQKILADPMHAVYLTVIDLLTNSVRGGVIRLVLSFLNDPQAPKSTMALLGRRSDPNSIEHLLRKIGSQPSAVVAQNLRHIETVAWLQNQLALVDQFDDEVQHSAVQFALATSIGRATIFKLISHLLNFGKPGGRRAAAFALAAFKGVEANQLALAAVHDPDPQVQAHALAQLRPRGINGALPLLLAAVDGPYEIVRAAARRSLDEFSFERFLSAFEMLDDHVRRTTGPMVRKVDPSAPQRLFEELQARSRTRRLRAIGMATAMNLAIQLEAAIIERLSDEDHLVRAEAAKALVECPTDNARQALRGARHDRSIVVKEAAEKSLEQFAPESLVEEAFAIELTGAKESA